MKKLFPLALFFLNTFFSYSQKVENVDFNFVNEKIVIFYDLVDCDENYSYEVDIRFVDDQGNTIIPRNLTGGYGRISCGKNKRVEWDLFKEVNRFEGNYKAVVTIEGIFDKKGRVMDVAKRIVSIEEVNHRVEAQINQKLEVGTQFYVYSKGGITSGTGSAVKKVGKLEVVQSNTSNSTATFHLNKNLTPNLVKKHLSNLNLQKFRRFDIGLYTGVQSTDEGIIDFGGYVDCKLLNNMAFIGVDFGYSSTHEVEAALIINMGLTPYLFNSRVFSLGLEVQPLQIIYDYSNDKREIGPRFGVLGGFEFKRFKVEPSVGFYHEYVYCYDYYYNYLNFRK